MAVPRSQSATPVFPTTLTSSSLAVHTIVAPMARLSSPALALDVPLGPLGKRSDSVSINKVVNWWCMGVDSILRALTSLKLPVQAGRDSHHVLWVLLKSSWSGMYWTEMHMFSSLCESHTISSDFALHAAGSEQNFGINIRWNGNIQVYQIIRTLVSSLYRRCPSFRSIFKSSSHATDWSWIFACLWYS